MIKTGQQGSGAPPLRASKGVLHGQHTLFCGLFAFRKPEE